MMRSVERFGRAALLLGVAAASASAQRDAADGRVEPGPSSYPVSSPPLWSLPAEEGESLFGSEKGEDRKNPFAHHPDQGRGATVDHGRAPRDPLAERGWNLAQRTPSPHLVFEGSALGCGIYSPPDPVGDVGPHHYVQIVNCTKLRVFDKSGGLLLGPINLSTLWSSGACFSNRGDPVVVYDPLADRWVLAQFASPKDICVAVSQTEDPTGAYYVYDFVTTHFPDYFKIGVWPDGYYVSTNEAIPGDDNYNAWVFEREKMLVGLAAASQKASAETLNFLLAADVDGIVAPAIGAPGLFYTFLDGTEHGGTDRLQLWEFDVDWATPANSTFVNPQSPSLAPFTFSVCGAFEFSCAEQKDTTVTIDVVSEWPMFRFAYRNFGALQSAVGTFTVDAGGDRAAIRWFELRDTGGGWSLFQEGTFDPGTHNFFMGSIAQDALGDIALGYSASSSTLFPSIRYTTRLAGDPLGTLGSEVELQAGLGSQTGSNRWGDYSAMSIDPADDCTFWYTNEYNTSTAAVAWSTRIGAFRLPECTGLFLDNFETGGVTRWSATVP